MHKRPVSFASQGDDRETPARALQDIVHVLQLLALPSATTTLYDPYYCQGAIKTRMAALGYPNVINEPVDFYQTVHNNAVPAYDVLLTNPPYSGNHIRKALEFACAGAAEEAADGGGGGGGGVGGGGVGGGSKPWCMLLPSNVHAREWYESVVGGGASPPLFLCPHERYSFLVPSVASDASPQEHVPYVTMWYVGGLTPLDRAALLAARKKEAGRVASTTLAGTPAELPRRVRKLMRYNKCGGGKKKKKKKGSGKKKKKRKESSGVDTNNHHKRTKTKH